MKPNDVPRNHSTVPARSAIRRQRTLRYNSHARDRPSSSLDRSHGRSRNLDLRFSFEAARRAYATPDSTGPSVGNDIEIEVERDFAHTEATQRRLLESGRALLRNIRDHEGPRSHTRLPGNISSGYERAPLLSVGSRTRYNELTESRPTYENDSDLAPLSTLGSRTGLPEYIPAPPHSTGDASSASLLNDPTSNSSAMNLIPTPPTANQLDGSIEVSSRDYVARQGLHRHAGDGVETFPLAQHQAQAILRPHRHVSRESLDGLGDRRQSLSSEDDSWETLLTTMTPDERLPSTHSSFTSATAVTSSSSSNTASSYGSQTTAPSTFNVVEAHQIICDNTDTEESRSEDYYDTNGQALANSNPHARDLGGRSSTSAPERSVVYDSHRAELFGRIERIWEREEEIQQINENLDRFAQQLPEEWWAATGQETVHRRRLSWGRL